MKWWMASTVCYLLSALNIFWAVQHRCIGWVHNTNLIAALLLALMGLIPVVCQIRDHCKKTKNTLQ